MVAGGRRGKDDRKQNTLAPSEIPTYWVHSHAPSIRSHRGIKVVWPDFQPMRVPEEPVCVHLFGQKPVFTSLHLKSPVHVHGLWRRRQVEEAFSIKKTFLFTSNQLTMGTSAERSTVIYSMPPLTLLLSGTWENPSHSQLSFKLSYFCRKEPSNTGTHTVRVQPTGCWSPPRTSSVSAA